MHKDLMKVFDGIPLSISTINDEEFMVDVSGISRKNGKNFKEWSEGKRIKEIIKIYEKSYNLEQSELVLISGNKQSIHNKLLVPFARFISAEFEVWADNMIFDLLTGKKKLELENQIKSIEAVNKKYEKMSIELSKTKEELEKKTQHKLITYQDNTMSLRKVVSDRFAEYDIKEKDLWKFLCDHSDNILEDRSIRTSKKILLNNRYGKQVGDSIAFNEDVDIYIKEFIGYESLEKKPQQGTFDF